MILKIQLIISALQESFAVKDLGNLHYFLGIEALWCPNGVYLTQRKYIADLLKKTKMDHAKPCSSPMASSCRLTSTDGEPFEDDTSDDLQDEDQDIDQAATVTKPMITAATINPP
ncbi:hypothetical protein DKX38_019552 [Salix brachista]|uniref:Reverse transcriptase Ty1/copia-type domain-containing protein n=1 Tax=Salix brachista TaxID=2182728 RepID=A0A5N5KGI8_9ROSI|nr:hypothetical protein DKX38_019552 [Salix brachista]